MYYVLMYYGKIRLDNDIQWNRTNSYWITANIRLIWMPDVLQSTVRGHRCANWFIPKKNMTIALFLEKFKANKEEVVPAM